MIFAKGASLMEVITVVLCVIFGLFILFWVSCVVYILRVLFKDFGGFKRKQAEFEKRFSKNYDRRPPRNYK
jgi:hypothetical protein